MNGCQIVVVFVLSVCVTGRFITGHDNEKGKLMHLVTPTQLLSQIERSESSKGSVDDGKTVYRSSDADLNPLRVHFEEGVAKLVLNASESGYMQGVGAGIAVTKGASGILRFSLSLKAIPANALAYDDHLFCASLNDEEMKAYDHMFSTYSGGLEIPFLKLLGVNLNNNVGDIDLYAPETEQANAPAPVSAAREILENQPLVNLQLSGSRTVVGLSFIQETYFAFIKVAKVQLLNGSTVLLISAKAEDVAIATSSGTVMDFGADSFQMIQEVDI